MQIRSHVIHLQFHSRYSTPGHKAHDAQIKHSIPSMTFQTSSIVDLWLTHSDLDKITVFGHRPFFLRLYFDNVRSLQEPEM